MMKLFLLTLTVFFISCVNSSKKSEKESVDGKLSEDSLAARSRAIRYFKDCESSSLDSVRKYRIDSLNEKCKNILYVLYGTDSLSGIHVNKPITIGECNIRLMGFKNISFEKKYLAYGLFFNDSMPVAWEYRSKTVDFMIHGFDIDLKKNKIGTARIDDYMYSKINEVESDYESIKASNKFKNYVLMFKDKLNRNFKIP
ncbi:MAG: hypothetical protein Q8941_22395 [Bacteroidota bacterium]|nr:hypothetical protein [Bacteroidota bacterium]